MTKITFLGTGTSQGVPVIACDCWVCRSDDSRDKRLRTSALIEHNGVNILIDAGPDFRQQMLREDIRHLDGIVLTHEHKDHIAGIDDVRAFNGVSRKAVDIYAEKRVQRIVKKDFDYAFKADRYPGVPSINLITIDEKRAFEISGVEVIPIRGMHHRLPVLGFRIGEIAYLTDFNSISDREVAKIKDVEILVINALREKSHLSHFTLKQALEVRERVNPQKTYFTHISDQMGRYAEKSKELPENCWFAYDGLVVETTK